MKRFCLLAILSILFACQKEYTQRLIIDPAFVNMIDIGGGRYEVREASYYDGYYEFFDEDFICLHLQFTQNGINNGAGMTIEIPRDRLGEMIAIAPDESFWFFHLGTGETYVSLESTYNEAKIGTHSGWFQINYTDNPDEIFLHWELQNNKIVTSKGHIMTLFTKLDKL